LTSKDLTGPTLRRLLRVDVFEPELPLGVEGGELGLQR
jgi:hypothetical protein